MASQTQRLGDYTLLEQVAGSAVAAVFLAQDVQGRQVALKALQPYFRQEPHLAQPFLDVAARLRSLDHPGVVAVLDVAQAGGAPAVAMEWVPWPTLRAHLDGGGPLPSQALGLLRQVAGALEAAHRHGVVHGDLKPGNVFWDPATGQAKVADFGTALLVAGAHPLIRETLRTPLPTYAAPEQLQGRPPTVRSDVFSLGVLAYRLLTGQEPFQGLTPHTVLAQQRATRPSAPSALAPGLPAAVDAPLLRALALAPEARQESPAALVQELEVALAPHLPRLDEARAAARPASPAAADDASAGAPPPSQGLPLPLPGITEEEREAHLRRVRRRRAALLVAAAVVVALVTVYNVSGVTVAAPATSSDLASASGPGEWAMQGRDPGRTGHAPGPAPLPEGRRAWQSATGGLLAAPAVARGMVFQPTGDGRVLALDAATGAARWELPAGGPVDVTPAVAGDLVFVGLRGGHLLAVGRDDGQERWRFNANGPVTTSPVVVGGAVFFGSGDHRAYAVDALTGRLLWSYQTGGWMEAPPAVAGDTVAVGSTDGHVYLLDRRSGKLRFAYVTGFGVEEHPVVADGRVVVASRSALVRAIDLQEREVPFDRAFRRTWYQLWVWNMVPPPPLPRGFVWMHRLEQEADVTGLAAAQGLVLVASDSGTLVALDAATGDEVWRHAATAGLVGEPVVAGDVAYVADRAGGVVGLALADGREVFRHKLEAPAAAAPVYAGGVLYVAAASGVLYAIE